jgi:hypothetical protein
MSQSFSVECPNCHARGELADTSLLGQQIACPGCQHVFLIPLPNAAAHPDSVESAPVVSMPPATDAMAASGMLQETTPTGEPGRTADAPTVAPHVPSPFPTNELPQIENTLSQTVPAIASAVPDSIPVAAMPSPVSPAPQLAEMMFPGSAAPLVPVAVPHAGFEGSVPPAEFLAPPPLHGPAEEQFAAALPPPAARGSMKPHQPKSKTVTMLGWGSLAFVVLFTLIMFLLGDPFRKPNRNPNAASAKKDAERAAETAKPQPGDKSLADILSKLQESSKSSSGSPPSDSADRKK